jgi:hypothetical protein
MPSGAIGLSYGESGKRSSPAVDLGDYELDCVTTSVLRRQDRGIRGTREDAPMDIGEQIRTLYIEPIEEPRPTEVSAPVELVPDPLPDPRRELHLA